MRVASLGLQLPFITESVSPSDPAFGLPSLVPFAAPQDWAAQERLRAEWRAQIPPGLETSLNYLSLNPESMTVAELKGLRHWMDRFGDGSLSHWPRRDAREGLAGHIAAALCLQIGAAALGNPDASLFMDALQDGFTRSDVNPIGLIYGAFFALVQKLAHPDMVLEARMATDRVGEEAAVFDGLEPQSRVAHEIKFMLTPLRPGERYHSKSLVARKQKQIRRYVNCLVSDPDLKLEYELLNHVQAPFLDLLKGACPKAAQERVLLRMYTPLTYKRPVLTRCLAETTSEAFYAGYYDGALRVSTASSHRQRVAEVRDHVSRAITKIEEQPTRRLFQEKTIRRALLGIEDGLDAIFGSILSRLFQGAFRTLAEQWRNLTEREWREHEVDALNQAMARLLRMAVLVINRGETDMLFGFMKQLRELLVKTRACHPAYEEGGLFYGLPGAWEPRS